MSESRNPKPLTLYEASAQLALSWWQFVEAAFDWWKPLHRHAQLRWSEAFVRAVEHRADLVGRRQAEADYADTEDRR